MVILGVEAERMVIEVEDSYQDVFRYMKLCRLMHTILRRERGYRSNLMDRCHSFKEVSAMV